MVYLRTLLLPLTLALSSWIPVSSQNLFQITECKTEYLINPIGIDLIQPRFTWKILDQDRGFRQNAYRILVSEDSSSLLEAGGKNWNSDWVSSDISLVEYRGQELKPFTKYFWRVDVRSHDNRTNFSIASFETGMMHKKNWKGGWISDSEDIARKEAPYFRKEFNTSRKIKSARAYIAVAGLFEFYVNGRKVGNHSLDPIYTRFDRRTLYVTHDVTHLLTDGPNAMGILLGNGWYNHQSTAVWNFHVAPWRNRPTFCLDMRITYTDGSVETITSGKDWKTSLGPLIFNSIYTAEHYDSRNELGDWSMARFDDKDWKPVINRSAPSPIITTQALHPIRRVEKIEAKGIKKINDTIYVFDFGRNISGVSELTIEGARGTKIFLKHGERVNSQGRVDLSNIDVHYRPKDASDPFQTDIFILHGNGPQTFTPRFNYKGFQYVEVRSDKPLSLTTQSLRAYFMHSDVPTVGSIRTSNQTLNKICEATNNSYLSNLFGYPTDCPQREKNGWTGDAVIANETGLYNFDGITIYEKWLADHRDEQQPNGVLPSIIPTGGWGYEWGNGPDWTSSIAMIPWNIYLFYGDKTLLTKYYDNIKLYVDHITGRSPDGLTDWGLGDWVPVKSKSPVELTSTCYYYADALILSKAALLLGEKDDHVRYAALAEKIKRAFNDKYLNIEKGIYGSGLQTELSVPLYWGLVPEELKEKIAASLAKRVEQDHYQLDVGLLGQKAILNALSENGYAGIAYQLAARESFPSWGWWIKNGATTLYENWNINATQDISLNHIMFGEVGAWLYKGLGGIYPDSQRPGFKHIILKPNFVQQLDQFEAIHVGPYGAIKSSWQRKGDKIYYTVVIPPNSEATLYLSLAPNQKVKLDGRIIKERAISLESGTHVFTL